MKWDEMTAEQRDALVSEKVMGVSAYCHGTLRGLGGSASALICTGCNQVWNRYDIGDPETFHHLAPGTPHYTTDMNATRLILDFIKTWPPTRGSKRAPSRDAFDFHLGELLKEEAQRTRPKSIEINISFKLSTFLLFATPEMICHAVFEACNIEESYKSTEQA